MQTTNEPDNVSPWGTYAPRGILYPVCNYLMMLGAGRIGTLRKKLRNNGLNKGQDILDIEAFGIKYRLYPRYNVCEKGIMFNSKRHDNKEVKILEQFMVKGSVFFDVGANIGYYSLAAAKQGARCYAFEPMPQLRRRQEFNIKINGYENLITLMPYALGENSGNIELLIAHDGLGGSTINPQHQKREGEYTKINVEMKTLMEIVTSNKIDKIDGLKIDIEGSEDKVLMPFFQQASKQLLPRLVIIENWAGIRWQTNVIEYMKENGYREYAKISANTILVKT